MLIEALDLSRHMLNIILRMTLQHSEIYVYSKFEP